MQKIFVYDNMTIKYMWKGHEMCLHILRNEFADNPRYFETNATMACFHKNYQLGDVKGKSPVDFWNGLVEKYSTSDGDVYSVSECMEILKDKVAWLPLWLYDHSGITMSCGKRSGIYADVWDSMPVGWIVISKEDVIDILGSSEEEWRSAAEKIMQEEVMLYDYYLRGEIYEAVLKQRRIVGSCMRWGEIDRFDDLYGDDLISTGLDEIGYGLKEALESGDYTVGEAKKVVTYTYEY